MCMLISRLPLEAQYLEQGSQLRVFLEKDKQTDKKCGKGIKYVPVLQLALSRGMAALLVRLPYLTSSVPCFHTVYKLYFSENLMKIG